MDEKQLKARIKSLKDVYRQELHKIEKSKKSGCGTEEVYSPKLAWFNEANYLLEVLTTRISKSNLVLSQKSEETEPDEGNESCWESVMSTNDSNCPEKEGFKEKSPAKMRPPAVPIKKIIKKRVASNDIPSEISVVIHQLDKIAKNAADDKPYDQFGKFVAAELRQLPQRQAILLQQEIQNCIIRSKLSSLEPAVNLHSLQSDVALSPSPDFSFTLPSVSSNDDDDILRQIMVQTFGSKLD